MQDEEGEFTLDQHPYPPPDSTQTVKRAHDSTLDANHLPQRVHHFHQVRLRGHYRID